MTAATVSAVPLDKDVHEYEDERDTVALSRGAGVLVILVAFLGTIAATVDVLCNGWWPALAHVAWFVGVFCFLALVLTVLLTFVFGGRTAAEHSDEAGSP